LRFIAQGDLPTPHAHGFAHVAGFFLSFAERRPLSPRRARPARPVAEPASRLTQARHLCRRRPGGSLDAVQVELQEIRNAVSAEVLSLNVATCHDMPEALAV
jgi:hypothetical protein